MQSHVQQHLSQVLSHLYINPLEKCNLKCKICYTRKTAPMLSNDEIIAFVERYQQQQKVETITFCGGEVFALVTFPTLVNSFTDQGIFVQIITNGTIDKLDEFTNPNLINLIVSLDGVESVHDQNRGVGNFRKSISFLQKGIRLGFHFDIFSIVTQQNLVQINEFESSLLAELGVAPEITYHPRKPPEYLTVHPVSNVVGETDGFDFLTHEQMLGLMKTKTIFPPMQLGCYQIAVASDGKVYGCCEGITPLGVISDEPEKLIEQLEKRLEKWEKVANGSAKLENCLGCSQPEFVCGVKKYVEEFSKNLLV